MCDVWPGAVPLKVIVPVSFCLAALCSSPCTVKDKEGEKKIPAIRKSATISVTFTPRVFATPMRESKVDEEEEVKLIV